MRSLLPITLAFLLASCTGGGFAPTLPAVHHFERGEEAHAAAGFSPGISRSSIHAAVAWNPIHSRTMEGSEDRVYDSLGRLTVDSTEVTGGIAVALAAAHGRVRPEDGDRETFEIEGNVGSYNRRGWMRTDIFGGVAYGTYHATYFRVIALDPTRPWLNRTELSRVTFNYLRPSLGASLGATTITGLSRRGVAGGLHARLSLPIVVRTSLDDAVKTALLPELGGWAHYSPVESAQIELQWGGTIPVDLCHECDENALDVAHDLWDMLYASVGLRVRIGW